MRHGEWFKSSFSVANSACVEVRQDGATVSMRDSKNRSAGMLMFTRGEWRAFVDNMRAGHLDA
jgi:hypothetical protein